MNFLTMSHSETIHLFHTSSLQGETTLINSMSLLRELFPVLQFYFDTTSVDIMKLQMAIVHSDTVLCIK